MGIEAGGGRGGDVADVVGTGAARGHAEGLEAVEDADDIFGLELADLEVAAGGEIGPAGAPVLGHLGETAELMGGKDAAGDAQAKHKGVLRGGDVEEAEVLDAETVVFGRGLVLVGVLEELVPEGERVLLVLPLLFSGEVFDWGIEPERFGGSVIGEAGGGIVGDEAIDGVADEGGEAALRDACKKNLKVFLLLAGELCRIDNGVAHNRRSS